MLEHLHNVHVIGANGVGVSAVAKLLLKWGKNVSGSDLHGGPFFDELQALGADIKLGHAAEHLPEDVDLVIFSSAIPESNPERQAAVERGVEVLSFAEFLGELAKSYTTIAVTGTHGKSTTTAMIGWMLEKLGLDPTVIVGSRVPGWELGNVRSSEFGVRSGQDSLSTNPEPRTPNLLILEACEHMANHLKIHPDIGVITNVEFDHPDFYRDLAHVEETMDQFASQSGTVIRVNDEPTSEINLILPGAYNQRNAAGALAVVRALDLDETKAREALETFPGIWRRFEHLGVWHDADVYSDYGHHPTAIKETLSAAREAFPGRRLVHIFQPHQHARTQELFGEFVDVLGDADFTILVEIYGVAGRTESQHVSTQELVEAVQASRPEQVVLYAEDLAAAERLVRDHVKADDILFFQGAGDIDDVARKFV